MRKFLLVAAIASLPLVHAGAAWAQAAVGEPGLAAFNHPDADILHAGPGYLRFARRTRNALASVPVARHVRGTGTAKPADECRGSSRRLPRGQDMFSIQFKNHSNDRC